MKKTDSQRRAQNRYIEKGKSIFLFFPNSKRSVYDYIKKQSEKYGIGVATYIKNILEYDMKESKEHGTD